MYWHNFWILLITFGVVGSILLGVAIVISFLVLFPPFIGMAIDEYMVENHGWQSKKYGWIAAILLYLVEFVVICAILANFNLPPLT